MPKRKLKVLPAASLQAKAEVAMPAVAAVAAVLPSFAELSRELGLPAKPQLSGKLDQEQQQQPHDTLKSGRQREAVLALDHSSTGEEQSRLGRAARRGETRTGAGSDEATEGASAADASTGDKVMTTSAEAAVTANRATGVTLADKGIVASESVSKYCHICARKGECIKLVHCTVFLPRLGRDRRKCRKSFCKRCLDSWATAEKVASAPPSPGKARPTGHAAAESDPAWKCLHCRGLCPSNSRCLKVRKN